MAYVFTASFFMTNCGFEAFARSPWVASQAFLLMIAAALATGNAGAVTLSSLDAAMHQSNVQALGPAPLGRMLKNTDREIRSGSTKSLSIAPTRAQVVAIYNTEYLPGNTMPVMNWTGNLTGCNPGAINVAYQQSMIDRINVFRKIARLSPVTRNVTADAVNGVQAAALLMSVNNALNHSPPSSWTCYNTAYAGGTVGSLGGAAAGNSNLGLASGNLYTTNTVIDAYMNDAGANNVDVGHRTNILDSEQGQMATGVVPSVSGSSGANALWVLDFGTRSNPTSTPDGVAWPPKNAFIPYQLLPADSNRWSFQYPGANFSGATVSMTGGGAPYAPVAYDFKSTGCPSGFSCLPDDAVVWRPPLDAAGTNGVFYTSPGAADKVYTVNIAGVTGSGVPTSFSYTVTVIDPLISPNPAISGTITNGGGVSGVQFCARPSAGVSCNISSASGAYSCTVPAGWTGTLHSPIVSGNRIPAQLFASAVNGAVTRNVTAKTNSSFTCNLDIDNNGLLEPAFDGVAILRRMAGFNQSSMAGLAGTCAQTTAAANLFTAANPANFHAMNGTLALPETDGLVLIRAMQGLTGGPVTAGLTGQPGATRTIWGNGVNDNQIKQWLNTTCGTDFLP